MTDGSPDPAGDACAAAATLSTALQTVAAIVHEQAPQFAAHPDALAVLREGFDAIGHMADTLISCGAR